MIHVLSAISDSNIGGAGRFLLTLLKNADRSRFSHTVIVPEGSLLADGIRALGVKCLEAPGIAESSFSAKAVSGLRKLIVAAAPDVVHTHSLISARLAARLAGGCRVIATRHSVFDQPAYKKRFPAKQLSGLANNMLADGIIAVSPAARDNLVETGTDPRRITVIYNGVDPAAELAEAERQSLRRSYGLGPGDFVCAMIARLDPVKGHALALEAMERLRDYSRVKLIIAGTGPEEAALKQRASDLPNVIFAGFVRDIHTIENIMDIQINASFGTEATSLSLLEGMSLGKPAVASDFGGNPFVIENGLNGTVFPTNDAEALAKDILRLYGDGAFREGCAKGAREIYNRRFTSQIMVKNIEDYYLEILDK